MKDNEQPIQPDVTPSHTALVAAFQERELDDQAREDAISSLRWACDGADYDQLRAMGDLSGAEVDLWDMTL